MSQPGISEKIGTVLCADGSRGVAYCALRDLVCSSCGAIIKTSELFTRWRLAAAPPTRSPNQLDIPRLVARCCACVPFDTEQDIECDVERHNELPAGGSVRASKEKPTIRKSALVEHLLTPARSAKEFTPMSAQANDAGAGSETGVGQAEEIEESQTASEAVYQRLAPALKGTRRHEARSKWQPKRRR